MQDVNGGPIKIGFSDDIDARRKQLEFSYGRPLAILATMPGGREEEAEIHARFSHLRLGRKEQFRPAADLLNFINRPLLVDPNPEAVEAMEDSRKPMVVQMRGSEEWKAFIERLAEMDGDTVAKFIERLIRKEAKERGITDLPKR
jgi:hypothetical protein